MENFTSESINHLRHNARSVVRELGLLNDAYFDIGVTLAERHLLIELSVSASPTMGEIAERLILDKSTVSRLISNAVKKNYVKCITDEKDKRKKFLQLTKKGEEVLHAFEPIAYNQTKEALLTLTEEEGKRVHEGIALYAKGLRSSRLRNKNLQDKEEKKKSETLEEISNRLNQLGFVLDLFNKKDEEALYRIFHEVVESGSQFPYESSSKQEFHLRFFSSDGHVYVCRSHEGEVVGGFYLRSNGSTHIANAGYMIKDAYRGKGIGSLLIKASLHLAKERGFQAMQFNMVLSENRLAIKLYEKLGFNIMGKIPQGVRNRDGSYQDGYVVYRQLNDL